MRKIEMNRILENIYIKYNKYKTKEFKYWNVLIATVWIILYSIGWLTVARIKYFLIIIIMIIIYKKMWKKIESIKTNISEIWIYRIMKITEKSNVMLYIIARLEEANENYIIKSIMNMLIPIKMVIYNIYQIAYRFRTLTIYEIMWKRAYGLILSVLIFTNIIQILITELGSRTNLYIIIYLMIITLTWEYKYQEKPKKDDMIYYLYNLDTKQLWEKRIESNMLCWYIKAKWQERTVIWKLEFLRKYGASINVEWLKALKVEAISVFENENQENEKIDLDQVYYKKNIYTQHICVSDLVSTLSELLKYESELEYLKILYEKYNELDKDWEIVKQHNVDELLEYNTKMVKAMLYYIWDIKGQEKIKIEIDTEDEDGLKIENIWDIEITKKEISKKELKLTLENLRKLYEINLFTNLYGVVYMAKTEKYEKYIKYWKWENTQIEFWYKEEKKITKNWIRDTWDIRTNLINVSEINEEWEKKLENKIEEYKKEYKAGKYLEYFEKL